MQALFSERLHGLTDGISSRYLRANRSALIPSLVTMQETEADQRTSALHGRLEELLIFEIPKDG